MFTLCGTRWTTLFFFTPGSCQHFQLASRESRPNQSMIRWWQTQLIKIPSKSVSDIVRVRSSPRLNQWLACGQGENYVCRGETEAFENGGSKGAQGNISQGKGLNCACCVVPAHESCVPYYQTYSISTRTKRFEKCPCYLSQGFASIASSDQHHSSTRCVPVRLSHRF